MVHVSKNTKTGTGAWGEACETLKADVNYSQLVIFLNKVSSVLAFLDGAPLQYVVG